MSRSHVQWYTDPAKFRDRVWLRLQIIFQGKHNLVSLYSWMCVSLKDCEMIIESLARNTFEYAWLSRKHERGKNFHEYIYAECLMTDINKRKLIFVFYDTVRNIHAEMSLSSEKWFVNRCWNDVDPQIISRWVIK